MDALQTWFAMGGYAPFVWPSFAASALVIGGLAVSSVRAFRRAQRALAALEQGMPSRIGQGKADAP